MAGEFVHPSAEDRLLLTGVESSLAALSPEELSSLRRVLSMGIRIAPIQVDASDAIATLRENVGRNGTNDVVETLASQMINYLDRSMQRIENGLRTWMGVQVSLRLRELEEECTTGEGER